MDPEGRRLTEATDSARGPIFRLFGLGKLKVDYFIPAKEAVDNRMYGTKSAAGTLARQVSH